jgi:ATP-binding cassette subfamily A (ABC1) protein 3
MNLLLRQIWALIRKNLLLICVRSPITTFIRAFAIPLAIVLIIGYSKTFFASSQHWGVSSAHQVGECPGPWWSHSESRISLTLKQLRSLEEGLQASAGHDIVGFVDNGMKGGEVASVIESISQRVSAAGKIPMLYKDTRDLALNCRTDDRGESPCYGAVVFESSPTEGTDTSSKGYWNYTIRGVSSMYGLVDVRTNNNGPETAILPLQRAIDLEIIAQSKSGSKSQIVEVDVIGYTDRDQQALGDSRTATYLSLCVYVFGPIFAFAMIEVIYHMTSFVSRERELGTFGRIFRERTLIETRHV